MQRLKERYLRSAAGGGLAVARAVVPTVQMSGAGHGSGEQDSLNKPITDKHVYVHMRVYESQSMLWIVGPYSGWT